MIAVQFVPLFVDRKTPPLVPTKRFGLDPPDAEAIARDKTVVFPKLLALQFDPLLVERKISPPIVAARTFELLVPPAAGEMASAYREAFVNPVLTQLVPLFVERKRPWLVPAKRFVPEAARA